MGRRSRLAVYNLTGLTKERESKRVWLEASGLRLQIYAVRGLVGCDASAGSLGSITFFGL